MNKIIQAKKNLKLTVKLTDYLAKNPEIDWNVWKEGVSLVPFSATDKKLNSENNKLVEELLEEGKKVVKAEETKNSKEPWKFIITSRKPRSFLSGDECLSDYSLPRNDR
jgi:hypothetical protein